ncbi:hypothetical protein [Ohtaekwangia sp.]|uniref:hypothetical protein n=1 Tax=Ohtaekwangia sp. TaxID=2066019 RepID=UPI002F928C97
MLVKVYQLRKTLEDLAEKAEESLDWKGLQNIAIDKLKISNDDYLYKRIFNKIQGKKANDTINLHPGNLEVIAKYLGHRNFKLYLETLQGIQAPQLLNCIGTYYSYVRRNAEKGAILRSPVRIWNDKSKIAFELKGPGQKFTGNIQLKHGCLFILMEAKGGKAFYHIYKIGTREVPHVLLGVFAGVSTAFDPIGGRAVLIKKDIPYAELTNQTLDIPALQKSKQLEERRLAEYFKDYKNNNVASGKAYSFGLDDLGECR